MRERTHLVPERRHMSETRRSPAPGLKDYAAVYTLFAVILVLAYAIFWIWRQTLLLLLQVFLPENYGNRSILLFSMVLIALGLFVVVLSAEPYLRKAIQSRQGDLVRRFLRIALPLAGLCAVGLLLRILVLAFVT